MDTFQSFFAYDFDDRKMMRIFMVIILRRSQKFRSFWTGQTLVLSAVWKRRPFPVLSNPLLKLRSIPLGLSFWSNDGIWRHRSFPQWQTIAAPTHWKTGCDCVDREWNLVNHKVSSKSKWFISLLHTIHADSKREEAFETLFMGQTQDKTIFASIAAPRGTKYCTSFQLTPQRTNAWHIFSFIINKYLVGSAAQRFKTAGLADTQGNLVIGCAFISALLCCCMIHITENFEMFSLRPSRIGF